MDDFTLAPASACIGAADTNIGGLPTAEYYENEVVTRMYRVRASALDLGAFEHTTTGAGIGPYGSDGGITSPGDASTGGPLDAEASGDSSTGVGNESDSSPGGGAGTGAVDGGGSSGSAGSSSGGPGSGATPGGNTPPAAADAMPGRTQNRAGSRPHGPSRSAPRSPDPGASAAPEGGLALRARYRPGDLPQPWPHRAAAGGIEGPS